MIFVLSLAVLIWSAHMLVGGASGIALYYRVNPLLIGLTIVAIGTSAPEIMVSIVSSLSGAQDLAVGNAIGSNIANIGLIVGLTALLRPVYLQSSLLRREYPVLFVIMLIAWLLVMDGFLGTVDGALLLLTCFFLMAYLYYLSRHTNRFDPVVLEIKDAIGKNSSIGVSVVKLIIGILLLSISSHYLVDSAVLIATWAGVSQLMIGLTIVAIGTSLPELATSLVAILKREDDLAIGNIIGSNMFNIVIVMAIPGLIHPAMVDSSVLWRDIPLMIALSLMLLLFNIRQKKMISRIQAVLLLTTYLAWMAALIFEVRVI